MLQWAILIASLLLLIGFTLRAAFRVFQWLYIPASVIGGLFGLLTVQIILRWYEPSADQVTPPAQIYEWTQRLADTFSSWPGILIAVVFAGLLLERPGKTAAQSTRSTAQAAIMVWIIVLGEIAVGLLASMLLIRPFYDVPAAFGQLIEAGFAGGHGTATALGRVYTDVLEFPEGFHLGLFMATIGLIYSVVSGIFFVNIAVRRGWTRSRDVNVELVSGLEARDAPQPTAMAHVRSEVIDPLAFQLIIVAMAFLVGWILQWLFVQSAGAILPENAMKYVGNVPLFMFTLIGGWTVRHAMQAIGMGDLIDTLSVKRIVAIAMEFLIVAAIASLRIEVIETYFTPLLILCLLGFAWTAICLLVISRIILPSAYWFELGIINYGMSTGTTAQGMMLLRIIDKDLDSGAAEDYALAAPFSAPFVGGGVITLTMPLLLLNVHTVIVVGIMAVVMVGLFVAGLALNGRFSED